MVSPTAELLTIGESLTLTRSKTTISYVQQQPSLLVTIELNKVIQDCKAKVARIARSCRAKNRKFRDIEFDLENDRARCLEGLFISGQYTPSDVRRVTQIFEKPQFIVGGAADSNVIAQGDVRDGWFLSALATVSTAPGLMEKICVARDEKVGVYGFIFFRDNSWVSVIIDDLLFTKTPKYEELNSAEQDLYHNDKESYNQSARKGGSSLYFAKPGKEGETWIPLIEKAYAKLHGNYAHLSWGRDCEAVEDLTGGVSSFVRTKDILDLDLFWKEELCLANKDRLFGCSFEHLSTIRSGDPHAKVQGLSGGHAYAVLRAAECRGKRFVVVRNPWEKTEWNGPWSDGSKEWTGEWLEILPQLGHVFGDDGQFVMEYKDFLEVWSDVGRTVLFDENWVMSSQWLHVPVRPLPAAWSYGDVSFTFSLPGPSVTVIVLSQLDSRYFRDISSRSQWSLDFVLVREGEKEPMAESTPSQFYSRSINLELNLEAGNYIVYVRIDHSLGMKSSMTIEDHQLRHFSRTLTERTKSQSVASNFKQEHHAIFLPTSLSSLIDHDFSAYKKKQADAQEKVTRTAELEALTSEAESAPNSVRDDNDDEISTTTTTTTVVVKKVKKPVKPKINIVPEVNKEALNNKGSWTDNGDNGHNGSKRSGNYEPSRTQTDSIPPPGQFLHTGLATVPTGSDSPGPNDGPNPSPNDVFLVQDENSICLGLRVYTHKDVPAIVVGRLKAELDAAKATEVAKLAEDVKAAEGEKGPERRKEAEDVKK